ncbi:ABC transporter ATP-binding protein [Bacillus shivajii]|uniref:ABC transporter ATP-binding protein n=1 Tax=Bacillus shivajii TaxID=1983719 RepID=UPI001CFB6020|nr:ABC transporter ATP-binding protein [Bacillus shivajii]UCZ53920.1 ABC transporter ATP-binding protein [Bacillus shivajii]
MSEPVLQFEGVSFHYAKDKGQDVTLIIDSLQLDVKPGEFVSIVGPSGSGKSTLFKLITGLEQPTAGNILINGEVFEDRLGHVGYMPQQDLLMPWRTIIDNASLPLELKGVKKRQAHEQVRGLLEEFGLKGTENKYPGDLSGGMKQRVSFLRTILSGSNVLLLDEPFSALDAITRISMQEWLLEQWKKWQKTVLFITHDVDEALFLSDRVFILTETPVQQLQEVYVPTKRPRSIHDLSEPSVVELKHYLLDQLRPRLKA